MILTLPTQAIAKCELIEFSTIAKAQPSYLNRRANTAGGLFEPPVTDTSISKKVEESRRNAAAFLRGLAEKFRSSYKWVKTSNGWKWVQMQGAKIGELMKKAWKWFSSVILRREPAEARIIQEKGSHGEVRPLRGKGKGRALMPAAGDIRMEGNITPLPTQGDATFEMEDTPGYGNSPGYRGNDWEKYTTYTRPTFGDAVPVLPGPEPGPHTDIDPPSAHRGLAETEFIPQGAPATVNDAIYQASVAELKAPDTSEAPAVYNRLILISPSLGDAVPAVFGFGPYTDPAQPVPATEQAPVIDEGASQAGLQLEEPVHSYKLIRPAFGDAVPAVFATE